MEQPLPSAYDLWLFDVSDAQKTNEENFFDKIRKTIRIGTLNELTTFYSRFKKPKDMRGGCEVYFFKEGVRPLWEDERNLDGGSFFLHIKKTFANKIWENLLLSIVSESQPELQRINGLIMRVLRLEVVFYVWTSKLKKAEEVKLIQWMKDTAGLSAKIKLEFKPHPKQDHKDEPKTEEHEDVKNTSPTEPQGDTDDQLPRTELPVVDKKKPFGQFDSDDDGK